QGTREVTENVTQSAGVAREIATDIADVNHSAQNMADTSGQVKISAEELNQLGEKLNAMMNRFTV
ncbi:MAG: methyl-accepting chemotaxis protein, partial [Desulfobacteraceae bacterium]